jgi:hypothetical protein
MKTLIAKIPDEEIRRADEILVAPAERPTATEEIVRFEQELSAPRPDTATSVPDSYTIVALYESQRERDEFIERCRRVRSA